MEPLVQSRSALEAVGHQHGDFERLLVIESGIDLGLICAKQVRLFDPGRAADTFCDILTRHLKMQSAESAFLAGMDIEGLFQLGNDVAEKSCFYTGGRRTCVAVHRITAPDDGSAIFADCPNYSRQRVCDLVVP